MNSSLKFRSPSRKNQDFRIRTWHVPPQIEHESVMTIFELQGEASRFMTVINYVLILIHYFQYYMFQNKTQQTKNVLPVNPEVSCSFQSSFSVFNCSMYL